MHCWLTRTDQIRDFLLAEFLVDYFEEVGLSFDILFACLILPVFDLSVSENQYQLLDLFSQSEFESVISTLWAVPFRRGDR